MMGFRFRQLALAFSVATIFSVPVLSQAQDNNINTGNDSVQVVDTSSDNTSSQTVTNSRSVFVSPNRDLVFALNVPNEVPGTTTDLYFSFALANGTKWGAVGLGSSKMAGALILMVYPSSSGQNLTISTRLASGINEPVFTPDVGVEVVPGGGIAANGGRWILNGRCGNCRTWANNGAIDVTSTNQKMIYATGEAGDMRSDDPAAPLRYHSAYGDFTMDMVKATGPRGIPAVADETIASDGVTINLENANTGKKDLKSLVHAVIMVFSFVGLWPFGVLLLRLGGWVRWHAINQTIALVFVIIGSALGFWISGMYNRAKKFNTAHQIIGILIFIFIFAQFALGLLHHRSFKKTQQKTKMAPIHVWLGRLIILLGTINGFLGFPLALAPTYNWVLAGLVLFVFPASVFLLLTKKFITKLWKKTKEADANGYDMESWRQQQQQQAQPQQPSPGMRQSDFGPPQSTREYV